MFYSDETLIEKLRAQAWSISITAFKAACLVLALAMVVFLITAPDLVQEIARQIPARLMEALGNEAETYSQTAHEQATKALKGAVPKKKQQPGPNEAGEAEPQDASAESASGYFTIGSSKADVLTIQGVPTRTDGNVWYYGQSQVTFLGDRVARWRSQDMPLRAAIARP